MENHGGATQRPPVTVVVATRDRPARLARCLWSLRTSLRDDDELIVVDSASHAAAATAAAAHEARARLLRCERPGVDRARNVGWRAGCHPVVLFTDDDVVVDDAWADRLALALLGDPAAGFVTGRLLAPAGQVPSRDVALKREDVPAVFDASSVGNLGHGASVAVRRTVLEQVGGWDESLGAGGRFGAAPETDLFDRCFAAGWTGRYEPAAVGWHEQWRGPRRLLLLEARYGYGSGARLAKLLRTDRRRAGLVARDVAWAWGLRELWREVRLGHGYPALGAAVRLLATVAGLLRALPVPVVDGHFRPEGRPA